MEQILEKELIYEKNHATSFYFPESKTAMVVWNGTPKIEEYKETFLTLLDFADNNNKKVERFISNTLKQGVVSISSRKFFETEVTPRAVKQGLTKTAVITDANAFKRYYLNFLIKASAKFGNDVKLVSSEQEAWDHIMK